MANIISDETIEYVGILAKLELSDEEKERAKKDMGDMLDYIDQLNDVVTNGDGSEATLLNAPCKKDGGFKVPKTIG